MWNSIRFRWLLTGLCLGLVGILSAVIRSMAIQNAHPPDLNKIGRKIVSGVQMAWPPYGWLSQDKALVWREERREYMPYEVDAKTGNLTPLKSLHAQLAKAPQRWEGRSQVSPDGRWILWLEGEVKKANGWVAFSVDGRRMVRVSRPHYPVPPFIWERNSNGWLDVDIDFDGADYLMVARHYRLQPPGSIRKVALPRVKEDHGAYDYPIGFNAQGSLLMIPYNIDRLQQVPIYEVDVETGKEPIHKHIVQVPHGALAYEVVASRKGDRLAWVFYFQYPPDKPASVQIWISRWDGSAMRPLVRTSTQDRPDDLRWLPGDQEISFRYKDALWTVPVD